MEIQYVKHKEGDVVKTLENSDCLKVTNLQNYIPLYTKFFKLSENNFNSINLNHKYSIVKFLEKTSYNKVSCIVKNNDNGVEERTEIFIKYSPLIDPVKYMVGKYKNYTSELFNLPKFNLQHICAKTDNPNNSAYVDSFFSFLTNNLLVNYNFSNGTKFYGSFLANKNEFRVNIFDDIEYLDESKFFNANKGKLFKIDDTFYDELFHSDSRDNKKQINIGENVQLDNLDTMDNSLIESVFESPTHENIKILDISNAIVYDYPLITHPTKSCKSSSCSSRSSNTSNEKSNEGDFEDEEIIEENSDSDDSQSCSESLTSSQEEESIYAYINNFPVDIICLESCDDTLDHYMLNNDVETEEWEALLFQVIMTLITYQKAFTFTHNDLHTNNIMFTKTEKEYLIYHYNKTHYKVKTFGKIWKIIDFGRAIYKYQGQILCSDSFHPSGDAATQYNCEPYLNDTKPRLDPNYSFDLCRLGCALFDYFIEDHMEIYNHDELDDIQKLVVEWCQDDNKKNVLYKKNGEERYPDFKLYKMISRLCHNHTPQQQLKREMFSKFKVTRKSLNKKAKIINIDQISYMG